MINKLESAQGL